MGAALAECVCGRSESATNISHTPVARRAVGPRGTARVPGDRRVFPLRARLAASVERLGPTLPGGAADAQGIQQGMRLVSVNGLSLLGETLEEATRQLDGASKPWELVLERMAGKEDTGRTLFQLVQQIKEDVSSSTRTVHLPKLCSTHTPVCPSVCACA